MTMNPTLVRDTQILYTKDGKPLSDRMDELSTFRAPVDTLESLPISATPHERRLVKSLGKEYIFDEAASSWKPFVEGGNNVDLGEVEMELGINQPDTDAWTAEPFSSQSASINEGHYWTRFRALADLVITSFKYYIVETNVRVKLYDAETMEQLYSSDLLTVQDSWQTLALSEGISLEVGKEYYVTQYHTGSANSGPKSANPPTTSSNIEITGNNCGTAPEPGYYGGNWMAPIPIFGTVPLKNTVQSLSVNDRNMKDSISDVEYELGIKQADTHALGYLSQYGTSTTHAAYPAWSGYDFIIEGDTKVTSLMYRFAKSTTTKIALYNVDTQTKLYEWTVTNLPNWTSYQLPESIILKAGVRYFVGSMQMSNLSNVYIEGVNFPTQFGRVTVLNARRDTSGSGDIFPTDTYTHHLPAEVSLTLSATDSLKTRLTNAETNLVALSDKVGKEIQSIPVDVSGIQDGYVLTYDAALGKFIPKPKPSGGGESTSEPLGDSDLTTYSTKEEEPQPLSMNLETTDVTVS